MTGFGGGGASAVFIARRIARPGSLVALGALLLSPGLWLGPSLDASVFVLSGMRIRAGFVPYADLWDHKPPGSYLLNALGQGILPWLDPWLVAWLFTAIATGAAIVVFERMLRSRLSALGAYFWSVVGLVLIASFPVALGGGLTESLAILPLLVVLSAVARPVPAPSLRLSAASGLMLAVACLISLQAVPPAAVLFVAVAVRRDGCVPALKRGAAAVAGGVVLPIAIAGWLVARGAMGDALDQLLTFNAAYRNASSRAEDMSLVTVLLLVCLAIPAAITIGRMIRHPRAFDRIDWVCLAWTGLYALYIAYQGRIYLHYWIVIVPPVVWLAGLGAGWMTAGAKAPDRKVRIAATGLLASTAFAMSVSLLVVVGLQTAFGRYNADRVLESDAASWIDANTPASATLFVWGHDTSMYLLANRTPYDRYVYDFPLVTDGYAPEDHLTALLADWTASPPSVIVESLAADAPLLRTPDPGLSTPDYPALDALRAFVRSHYKLVSGSARYDVYVPVASGPSR